MPSIPLLAFAMMSFLQPLAEEPGSRRDDILLDFKLAGFADKSGNLASSCRFEGRGKASLVHKQGQWHGYPDEKDLAEADLILEIRIEPLPFARFRVTATLTVPGNVQAGPTVTCFLVSEQQMDEVTHHVASATNTNKAICSLDLAVRRHVNIFSPPPHEETVLKALMGWTLLMPATREMEIPCKVLIFYGCGGLIDILGPRWRDSSGTPQRQ